MGNYGIWQLASQDCGECYEPSLPDSILEGSRVLPINIHPIQVIVYHEVSQSQRALGGIEARRGGSLSGSKGADHEFDAIAVEDLLDIGSNSCTSTPEGGRSEVSKRVVPQQSSIQRPELRSPKSKADVVVAVSWCVSWQPDGFGYSLG